MASVGASIHALHAQLDAFANGAANELATLRRNVEQRPCAGATAYKHVLKEVDHDLTAMAADIDHLSAAGLGSLQVRPEACVVGGAGGHPPSPPCPTVPCTEEAAGTAALECHGGHAPDGKGACRAVDLAPSAWQGRNRGAGRDHKLQPLPHCPWSLRHQDALDQCAGTYTTACQQIRELESRLAEYGYREAYAPEPPLDPMDLLPPVEPCPAPAGDLAAAPQSPLAGVPGLGAAPGSSPTQSQTCTPPWTGLGQAAAGAQLAGWLSRKSGGEGGGWRGRRGGGDCAREMDARGDRLPGRDLHAGHAVGRDWRWLLSRPPGCLQPATPPSFPPAWACLNACQGMPVLHPKKRGSAAERSASSPELHAACRAASLSLGPVCPAGVGTAPPTAMPLTALRFARAQQEDTPSSLAAPDSLTPGLRCVCRWLGSGTRQRVCWQWECGLQRAGSPDVRALPSP